MVYKSHSIEVKMLALAVIDGLDVATVERLFQVSRRSLEHRSGVMACYNSVNAENGYRHSGYLLKYKSAHDSTCKGNSGQITQGGWAEGNP